MTKAITPPDWTASAVCATVDPELWYPEKGGPTQQAKQICGTCPVRADCLQYALDNNEQHGIWGGLTYQQRLALRRAAPVRSAA